MDNRITGALLMFVFLSMTITYALFIEDGRGSFGLFISWPSFLIVAGGGGGIIFMRKHTYQEHELGLRLKNELILAGWLGFLIGLVLTFEGMRWVPSLFHLGPGIAAAAITPYYGYLCGTIVEAFFTKDVKSIVLSRSEEEE
tara:strand:+ start:206 stop:631 length:426 start_codon:yes stop_codon:yes gene_type:complete